MLTGALLDIRCSLMGGRSVLNSTGPSPLSVKSSWYIYVNVPPLVSRIKMVVYTVCHCSASAEHSQQSQGTGPALYPVTDASGSEACAEPVYCVVCWTALICACTLLLPSNSLVMCRVKCGALTSEAKCVKSRYINFTLMDFISHGAESHGD